jgi:hypothetical protein
MLIDTGGTLGSAPGGNPLRSPQSQWRTTPTPGHASRKLRHQYLRTDSGYRPGSKPITFGLSRAPSLSYRRELDGPPARLHGCRLCRPDGYKWFGVMKRSAAGARSADGSMVFYQDASLEYIRRITGDSLNSWFITCSGVTRLTPEE